MAGLGRKIFTAGDVLTASDTMNFLMDQTVMNFAGTAARSSAIATPTDGMVTYNQTNNSLEAYNGSEWINTSGLQLIKKQTILSAVSSVVVTGAFSATYDSYKIIISGGACSATPNLALKLGASATGYLNSLFLITYSTAATGASAEAAGTAITWAGTGSTNSINMNLDLTNPFLAKVTPYFGQFQGSSQAGYTSGIHNVATSYTDFTITPSTGTLTGGTIYVYGYGV